jgi:protein SCO1/2
MLWLPVVIVIIVLVGMGTAVGITTLRRLPEVTAAPSYLLINQDSQPVSSADLRGKVVVYNFIYTSCETVCPAITGQMLQLQRQLAEDGLLGQDVVLVTITFDPERDTPERLADYARQMRAGSEGWLWLTGEPAEVKQLVGAEFGVYFEKVMSGDAGHGDLASAHPDLVEFVHDTTFTLVDEQGMIRAEYHEFPDGGVMLDAITALVREKNARGVGRAVWRFADLMQRDR